ncbi:acyltransferase family protein [Streptomyces sp. NPDC058683]|uniref:acyltransferase family protein n=1 Tax=Streptomyces sp. NPDC058683 TaxID=3346597 RepID=UPI0036548D51
MTTHQAIPVGDPTEPPEHRSDRHRRSAPKEDRLRKYRPDLQGLRAVAITMVVLMHTGILGIHGGVDVSFTLSGFLIGSQLLAEIDKTGKVSLGKFWARRFRRLAPGASLVIVVTAVVAWIYASPFRFRDYMSDGFAASLSFINWRLAENGTDYFANDGSQSPYQHFWSLGIEEQFYVVAPLALVVVAWFSRVVFRSRFFIGLFLATVIGGSLYLSVTQTQTNQPLAYFGTQTRVWELALGVFVALNARLLSRVNQGFAAFLTWAGLGTTLVTALLITEKTPLPGYAVGGPVLGAALVIAGGCAAPRHGVERVLFNPVTDFVGNVSYGWYLWHWPMLILWPEIVTREFSYSDRFRVAAGSFVLAVATHYLIERRLKANAKLVQIPWRGILVGLTLTGTAAVATTLAVRVPLNLSVQTASGAAANGYQGIASVEQAVKERDHPRISESALLKAPSDRGDHGCIDDLLITGYTLRDECVIGDTTAKRTMVLMGDSHAYQWGNAFNELGKKLHVKVITVIKSGCTPEVYKITREDLGRDYTECTSWRKTALDKIDQLKPDVLVVANRVQGTTTEEGADQTFKRLKATGAKLVYLTDTPYPNRSVPDCLAQNSDDIGACSRPSTEMIDRAEFRLMEREAAQKSGFKVIDTIPAFCADGYCPAVIGGHVVYWDYSHMSGSYALSLAPYLEPKFKTVLAG